MYGVYTLPAHGSMCANLFSFLMVSLSECQSQTRRRRITENSAANCRSQKALRPSKRIHHRPHLPEKRFLSKRITKARVADCLATRRKETQPNRSAVPACLRWDVEEDNSNERDFTVCFSQLLACF
jgi:hypothetical protein